MPVVRSTTLKDKRADPTGKSRTTQTRDPPQVILNQCYERAKRSGRENELEILLQVFEETTPCECNSMYYLALNHEKHERTNAAFTCLLKAAVLGSIEAQDRVDMYFEDGIDTKDHTEALFKLARYYDDNCEIYDEELLRATKYYQRAVDQGHVEAAYELGMSYLRGYGVKQDVIKGTELILKAAKNGSKDALDQLRKMC